MSVTSVCVPHIFAFIDCFCNCNLLAFVLLVLARDMGRLSFFSFFPFFFSFQLGQHLFELLTS